VALGDGIGKKESHIALIGDAALLFFDDYLD